MSGALAARYLHFAETETCGLSPSYDAACRAVAACPELLARLEELPPPKRQPNLLLAATRHAAGLPDDAAGFPVHVLERWDEVRPVMLSRRTQTNEPGRCACLVPVLGLLEGPLALIEVGASAGLCLLPDLYGYDWGRARLPSPSPRAPVFPCAVTGPAPLPGRHPEIAWRSGLDLDPLDPADPEAADWLKALVWPEQHGRRARLEAALELAASASPDVVRGDLLDDTEAMISRAPSGLRVVVMHTAVMAYLEPPDRSRFVELIHDLGVDWIANEGPRVHPGHAPPGTPEGRFVLALDGRPLALAGPHGQSLDWLSP